MLDTIQCAIVEIGRNCFLTLSNLSDDDIVTIWANVAAFVDRHMSLQKGVHISGLGTFTFSQQRLDVGHRLILIQRPVFVMSEKYVQIHGLSRAKQHVSGDIPIVELNFTFLALESPYDRDTVEGCVKETLQIMYRYVACNRNVHFTFKDIGVLTIRNNKVKMKFFREFLNAMDGSGSLVKVLSNRPGTADSVKSMKDVRAIRPATTNAVLFPRIRSTDLSERKSVMQSIKEENDRENDENPCKLQQSEINRENEQTEKMKEREKGREIIEMPHVKQPFVKQPLTPAKTSAICLTEDFQKAAEPKDLSERDVCRWQKLARFSLECLQQIYTHCKCWQLISKLLKTNKQKEFFKKALSGSIGLSSFFYWLSSPYRSSPYQSGIQHTNLQAPKLKTPPATACSDHCRAGQELCYLCMQRALKNVPVELSENRRRKEEEDEQMLQQYQQMKDQETLFQQQCEMSANREYNQKISAFNLGVAEAIKRRKNSKCKDFYKGYIFEKRPLTPPILLKQQQYSQCLNKQMEEKKQRENRKKQDDEFLDRLEQVQLAEDLAVQREQYLKEKHEQTEAYKKALEMQAKVKSRQLPAFESDSCGPIFGKLGSFGRTEEQKQTARHLFKEQLQAAADRKKNAILNQLYEQKTESDLLKRNRNDLVAEHKKRYENLQKMHKALEEAWDDNATMKRLKDYEGKQYSKAGGLFLLDQCNKYQRCYQCKRRLSNGGEPNIWNNAFFTVGTNLTD